MDQICCNGILFRRTPNGECCDSSFFDPDDCQTCTTGVVSRTYNPASHVCYKGAKYALMYDLNCVCGTTVINAATTVCINDAPQPRTDNSTCCGMAFFMVFISLSL